SPSTPLPPRFPPAFSPVLCRFPPAFQPLSSRFLPRAKSQPPPPPPLILSPRIFFLFPPDPHKSASICGSSIARSPRNPRNTLSRSIAASLRRSPTKRSQSNPPPTRKQRPRAAKTPFYASPT